MVNVRALGGTDDTLDDMAKTLVQIDVDTTHLATVGGDTPADNFIRAVRAGQILAEFGNRHMQSPEPVLSVAADLIADLLHLVDAYGGDSDIVLSRAIANYTIEATGEPL